MSQVTVICPGARRYNIKVTPNTVLLQVLEQACKKQKLDPVLYTIKHHGKLLDLSLPLRFSGIPNNGKLELVTADQPRSDDDSVMVAVQSADGTRFQSSFHSNTSLWDVLTHHKFDSSPDGMEPSLAYMRLEVCGKTALRSTTLRSIGLSTGSGLLRLTHRKVKCVVVSDMGASRARSSTEKGCVLRTSQSGGEAEERTAEEEREVTDMEEGEGKGEEKREVTDMEVGDGEEGEKEMGRGEEGGREVGGGEEGEEEMGEGEKGGGDEASDNEPCKKPTLDTAEPLPYFPALPFSYFSNERDHNNSAPSLRDDDSTPSPHPSSLGLHTQSSAAASLLREATQQHNHFPPEVLAAQLEEISSSPFAQFSGLSRPHPFATPSFPPPQPLVYDEPCERETMVFSLNDPLPPTATEEVGDAFFQHTVADVQIMHSDLKRQAKASDAPLMTKAMRAVKEEMKIDKYKKSVVRVYFPDRWVLQGCFRPHESLKMLVAFIRNHLTDPQVKFHLYTTPPKSVLRSGKVTFAEVGFVPTALVYVGTEEEREGPWLSASALEHAVSALHAHTRHRSLQT